MFFIPYYTEYLKSGNITYQGILDLDNFGLLNSRSDIFLTVQRKPMRINKLYMMIKSRDSKNTAINLLLSIFHLQQSVKN